MPLFAPVMRMRLPTCEGMSAAVHALFFSVLLIGIGCVQALPATQLIMHSLVTKLLKFTEKQFLSCHPSQRMSLILFTVVVFLGSLAAGLLGALTGLGGGVVLVPLLTLGFHVDIRYAIGASLVSVIATSSGSAAAYVREGFSSLHTGIVLEIATTIGAVFGAFLATRVPTHALPTVFAVVLLCPAWLSWRQTRRPAPPPHPRNPWSDRLRMSGSYPDGSGGRCNYTVDRIAGGFAAMFGAGTLSGLLGIGSGAG